jgi:hypothetical protein
LISDRDVWAAALLMVKRYGDDAMIEAADLAGIVWNLDDPEFVFAGF